eukprot:CAMPEP_0172167276 /NCGR_PEP_ID=MMETSP1050-20130122/9481_1 /TAXON_ID=233186 /ORGANISM="Cryptomonas curvata, Strain CCAP979/52" /LENGTH=65 /DNA_ID=CAMNT_0012838047 /DNA_START=287 /DNA_END=484 /DNA_ORIENTATION=+
MFALLAYFASSSKEDHTNEDWPEYTGGFSVSYDPSDDGPGGSIWADEFKVNTKTTGTWSQKGVPA